jgi:hypothetical protein
MEKHIRIYVPEDATQVLDRMDLSNGDTLMLLSEDPPSIGDSPLYCIEQYRDNRGRNKPPRLDSIIGRVWLPYGDGPALVKAFTHWLDVFRQPAGYRNN